MPATKEKHLDASKVPCCPELADKPCCDRLTFDYRLIHRIRDVAVEVKIRALFERCPGPLSLGDLVYSTTLLPGETVRLFTSSRKNRFTFDRETSVRRRVRRARSRSARCRRAPMPRANPKAASKPRRAPSPTPTAATR